MNIIFLQRLDQEGGGSRASLRATLRALLAQRPDWRLTLATENSGPLSRQAMEWGISHAEMKMPHFRNHLQRPLFWLACRGLAEWARDIRPDVIVSNEWVTAPHALRTGGKLGIPAISYVRDFAALQRGRKYQLHRMDRLLCVCESMRKGLIAAGYQPERIHTVYNPVLKPQPCDPEPELRNRIANHPGIDRWLLYLGRISPRKNQVAAVETLRRLREITGQRWGLLLAGDADETYVPAVEQAAKSARLEDAVLRLGMIARPGWLFDLADASVMTSKSEGLARVLIESFLCGKPGFSFPLEGLEDIYGDALPFFVPAQREPEKLAEKIASALGNADAPCHHTERLRLMLEERHSTASHVAALEEALRFS
jgi:glycosyltransferase involved in cell wall biosynthesis